MRRLLTVALSLGLVFASVQPAQASPGDQPLPGYTISNPPLAPAVVDGRPTRVLQGVHSHAGYIIEVPPRWNGRLALWAHGYRGETKVLTVDPPQFGLRQQWLNEGYAWAASSYYANSYDVRAGVTTTRELASLFGKLVQRPKKVFLAGVSMGGHVIARSLEQYPGYYDGALPLCGVLGDHELFDFFLDYHLVAQAMSGVRAFPPPPDYTSAVVPRIKQGLAGKEDQFRAIVVNESGGPRPSADVAYAYWRDFLFGLVTQPTSDNLADNPLQLATNSRARYQPNAPVDVNSSVQRVRVANPAARYTPHLTQVPAVFGLPGAPVVSLHGIGDLFVPFSMEQDYRDDVARFGRKHLLVQRAIRTVAHCEFSPLEVGTAWRDLIGWVDRGKRPAGDLVDKPSAVADPKYGCRFSDRTATGGTRALYPPC